MTRRGEFDAHRYLRETRHRPPQRRSTDRRGWAEAIALGLIAGIDYRGHVLRRAVAGFGRGGWVK